MEYNSQERRVATDGWPYTYAEFVDWYGQHAAPRLWQAAPWPAETEPTTTMAENREVQSPSVPPSGVPSPIHVGAPSGVPSPTVLTYNDIQQLQYVPGFGGKEACKKQRQLRHELLPQRIFVQDLTHCDWPWKQILKSQREEVQQSIIGPGITQFLFRLLVHEMDQNYKKIDSGERHVFEAVRIDGSVVQMHFHKNGSMDPPRVLGPLDGPASGSAPPPAQSAGNRAPEYLFTAAEIRQREDPSVAGIGRNEAHMAALYLLGQEHVGALDISDEVGFNWKRFLQNQVMNDVMIGPGICKVLVARLSAGARPCYVLLRVDNKYCTIEPNTKLRHNVIDTDWRRNPMLMDAPMATTPWMQLVADRAVQPPIG